jgi:hypothetical protein
MAKRISEQERQTVLRMLARGEDRDTIAAMVDITPSQVSAIAAHVTMGTYELPGLGESEPQLPEGQLGRIRHDSFGRTGVERPPEAGNGIDPVLLGVDAESGDEVFWNPDPETGSANPHVLVLGESGFGKTYTISCLLGELAQQGILSIVFDYGQGFSLNTLPPEFIAATNPIEILASRDGIDINPLQIFRTDLLGPVNVAQRVADTFARVYPRIGVQQHAVLRQAVLDVMTDEGITPEDPGSWMNAVPTFAKVQRKLESFANNPTGMPSRYASSVASHVSTMFVYNTFRSNGHKLSWPEMMESRNRIFVIQLKGLEGSLERAVTEFLLWNLIGYIESLGPSALRCFVVLDEAHKLSFDLGSPVEKLLREGRKFGLGLILASQQPEDFSPVAFANSATKIVFQVSDDRSTISRQLHRKVRNAHSFKDIYELITKVPRGWAYVVSENVGRVAQITGFSERIKAWTEARQEIVFKERNDT